MSDHRPSSLPPRVAPRAALPLVPMPAPRSVTPEPTAYMAPPEPVPPEPALPPLRVQPLPLDDIHVDDLLRVVWERGASDLHIAVGIPPVMRIDGALVPVPYERVTPEVCQRLIYDILTDEQIQRFEDSLELDLSYQLAKLCRFRVNVFRDRGHIAVAFRQIPQKIPTIRELGLPIVLESLTRLPRGLLLVTGPTGSGKSTTLAAMINQINMERSTHIISIEDPIEYLHTHKFSVINQREVGYDTHEFKAALREAVRENADIIMVGEMRDLETMQLAVTAAETGQMVFATLHTNSAATSVERIVDSFPPNQQEQVRLQLANNLVAIFCQQLLPRADGPGRVCAVEVMRASPAIRNLIRENKTHQITSMIQTSGEMGMQTMDQSLRDLYSHGYITMEECRNRAMNWPELEKMIRTVQGEPRSAAAGSERR